jgi:methionyl-tRNA formyltransferase
MGDGRKGRTVLDRLATDDRFTERYDLHIIVDSEGKTTRTLNRHGVRWEVADDPSNPWQAIEDVAPNTHIDYIVSCGWSYKIPSHIIDKATIAALNCHSSYLPDYKGQSVYRVQWAHAEPYGGVTIHRLTDEFDDGPIVTQERFRIALWDTPLDIAHKYSDLTVPLLREALILLDEGYEDRPNEGGRYFSQIPWTTTIIHGIVNHTLRAVSVPWRWKIPPTATN